MRYNLSRSPDRRLPEPAVRFYAAQLILALEHCHRLCVLHRDVKPENILLTKSGYIKVRMKAERSITPLSPPLILYPVS
jgi:serine/threonine protein kinase